MMKLKLILKTPGDKMLFRNLFLGICIFFWIIIFIGCRKDAAPIICKIHQPGKEQRNTDRPNIILFIADDVGYEIPTFTGGQSYSTPNLDFMAANGMQFTYFFGHPDGYPSRLALYTGKYNFRNFTFWGQIPETQKTIGNMLEDSGYNTCFVGKWQGDGGNDGIQSHGFQNYRVFLPFAGDDQRIGRYKTPIIYENGNYIDRAVNTSLYSEDLFSDYLLDFIQCGDSTKPFFGIYSFNLAAGPYVPTPDNPAYPGWDWRNDRGSMASTTYFPGMIAYMDKMIGKIIQGVKTYGVESNTVFIFCTDNATTQDITSNWRGTSFTGAKATTNWRGTLQPVVVYWPGKVVPGVSDALADYTDFLPTLADIAHVPRPINYGILDGVSFYDNLLNIPGQDRDWTFTHWNNNFHDDDIVPAQRYVQDHNYKLYDTPYVRFYDLVSDRDETNNLILGTLTGEQQAIKTKFEEVLSQMHK